jgi:Brp/Blh family beta-carotene 15,15'-monooxygenase
VILVAGLPHGAFDYYLLAARYHGAMIFAALAGYIALAGVTVLLWWSLPLMFLFSFLVYSAFHFGDSDWHTQPTGRKWAWGIAIVALPCLLATTTVASLFTVITGVPDLVQSTRLFGLLALPAAIYCCWPSQALSPNPMPALIAGYALVCLAAGPLAAFACYFACLHSPFHLRRWRQRTADGSLFAVYGLTALVLLCIAILVWQYPVAWDQASSAGIDPSALRYTFLALAALTVPHMTLLFALQRNDKLAGSPQT